MEQFPSELSHPSGAVMHLESDRLLVAASAAPSAATPRELLKQLGLVPEPDLPHPTAAASPKTTMRVNNTNSRTFARTADGRSLHEAGLPDSRSVDGVEWVAPIYNVKIGGRTELVAALPHALIVRPTADRREEITDELRSVGLIEDENRSSYLGEHQYFSVARPMETPAYQVRDQLKARFGESINISIELSPVYVPTALIPNDPMFDIEWNMERIGAGGTGMTAWDLQRGKPSIVVCVLDEGCQLDHPDLLDRYVHCGINLGSMGATGAPTGNHGTPCAGIVAGGIDNNLGIAGVAGNCRLLPAAFDSWSDSEVAMGIRYAISQGSRVLSMSFGLNSWNPDVIDPAIQEAFDAGAVLCVATHNQNLANGITYPATNPLVMACGATDQDDERKTPDSSDGDTTWGSNFGPQMSVVAPGVLCPSTDRLGNAGYTNTDYVLDFSGTSAATPHVAGLAALLLSADPSLSNTDVRDIIEQTAAKVGSVAYKFVPGHPNGTWNDQMGYGRIDAHAAVLRAVEDEF